ncbi:phosphatidylinositol:UDP-GlcNAc transferase PIG-C [Sphaerosporella brunnea]|uniref:Phosphatidylinositol:UDP-GlcNAc transferase PIG-C n=1 Tax=Sphaerosporella brunnea TaxID=1250544 RepID=A0A5J5EZ17_9PEZI|nr:phosphatidylinositol:UDP-GlcNAc transferase PIG-C [Sphaerosporella brunnea]
MPELFMPTPIAPQPKHRPSPPPITTTELTWSTPASPAELPAAVPQSTNTTTLQLPEVRHGARRTSPTNIAVDETGARRRKGRSNPKQNPKKRAQWKKLLWVKQDYPDNWVDPTFLKDLQRNINVHPYDFYSLVAESTVVVQHLASAVIFVTSFVAIYIEVVSPVSVVAVSTMLTVAGWAVWDMGWEKREAAKERAVTHKDGGYDRAVSNNNNGGASSGGSVSPSKGLGLEFKRSHHQAHSSGSYFPPFEGGGTPASAPVSPSKSSRSPDDDPPEAPHQDQSEQLRKTRVIATAKSALLIYFTLLGLSPILRSLTKGVTEDSIWAIATWLFIANFLSFDYGSGIERNFPASFSTNAAITSSVVLASRLTDTSHVFSLMLFSIQVFGLFPVFRRTLKHMSWNLHVLLTVVLVLGAAGGLMFVVGWGWAVAWVLGVLVGMGGCGWWMIDLQKYKNEIHGPWDPARPVIRRQWA